MNEKDRQKPFISELIMDYEKSRKNCDFVAMREIYMELWRRDTDEPPPIDDKEEIVFFTEISDENSVVFPCELSGCLGKICYITVFDGRINISFPDEEFKIVENYLKENSIEFIKTVFQNRLELSTAALAGLRAKNGDMIRIEFFADKFDNGLDIYNECDEWRFGLR